MFDNFHRRCCCISQLVCTAKTFLAFWQKPDLFAKNAFSLLLTAGTLLASIRMVLWVILLAADVPWLTDNNTSIACE